ncbi:MAG: efflux RND transporter periplasmic adaptor subunit [Bryobacteraceae bacterium]
MSRIGNSIGIATVVFLAGCSGDTPAPAAKSEAASKPAPVAVQTAVAAQKPVSRAVHVIGTLYPDEAVTMSAEVAGRVATIHTDFGQHVAKGAVIAELDKTEFQLQLERSKASLAQALARLGLSPDQENSMPDSTPAIRQARSQYQDAQSKYESGRKLVETGDIARERFTELEHALNSRKAAVESAEYELRTQLATVQALKAERDLAAKRLRDSTVRAPFDGEVTERLVSPGQYIKDNTPILKLVKSWPLRLRLLVPETAAGAVRPGARIDFTAEAVPGRTFTATVTRVDPALNEQSRSLTAEARISGGEGALKPGMFVEADLVIAHGELVTVIPNAAVYTIAGLSKAFVIRDGKANEIRFQPGQEVEGWTEVSGGTIAEGAAVAVSNLPLLSDGAAVSAR